MTKEQTLTRIREAAQLPKDWRAAQGTGKRERFGFIKDGPVSEWIITEYAACKSFPYLDQCIDEINERHSLGLTPDEIDAARTFIYFASNEKREREDRAEGWTTASEEWLAAREGQKVEVRGESIFGYSVKTATVKRIGGQLYLMPPRARRRCYSVHSVKVRDLGGPPARPMAGAVSVILNGERQNTQPGTAGA